ncbi:MAG: ABC transporter family substrate-binding protein [Nocardioides sp.]
MSTSRPIRLYAVVAATALALSACASQTSDPESEPDPDQRSGGTIRVAETNIFTSLNPNQAESNLDVNSKVIGTTRSDWQYINPDLELVKDESFGTFEKLSDDPLTVTYTVNDDVAWSDGNPIDKADLLLEWAIQSGYLDGEDPEKGPAYFQFAGDTSALALTDLPEFDGDRTMTLTYSKPYVDWEIAFGMGSAQPAHVVAERAGITEEELVQLLENAQPGEEDRQLMAVAKVWNEDFITKSLPEDPSMYLSSGPMIISEMTPDQSVTLVLNENYTGDLEPQVDEITVRFIGDASAQIAALRNGEIDIIAPQPTTDTVEQVKALDGVTVLEGSQLAYDHVDLSFDSEVFSDPAVREAFLLSIPRDEVVEKLIRPMYADAEVVDSQIYLPSEGEVYGQSVEQNGSEQYAAADIEAAKELLDGQTPTVRLLYNSENPVRVDAFQIIKNSAEQAGFVVEDMGDPDWGLKLGTGTYDASLFGWISSGVGSAGIPQLFSSDGGGNYSAYKNERVDQLSDQLLTEIDPEAAEEIKRQIDAELWADAFGVPLFQSPGLQAHQDAVEGVVYMPNQTGVWWNFWEWSLAS